MTTSHRPTKRPRKNQLDSSLTADFEVTSADVAYAYRTYRQPEAVR